MDNQITQTETNNETAEGSGLARPPCSALPLFLTMKGVKPFAAYPIRIQAEVYASGFSCGSTTIVEGTFFPASQNVIRKAFICAGCEGVYADDPVSSCDCLQSTEWIEGQIIYSVPNAQDDQREAFGPSSC